MTQERAVLAGGCFWGMQDLIRRHDGVISTRVGYTGGDVPNATYRKFTIQPRETARAMTSGQAIARRSSTRARNRGASLRIRSPTSMPPVFGLERS